jgi:hypothetical protein
LIPAEVKLVWFFETLKVVAANGSQHIVKTPETISSRGKDLIQKIKRKATFRTTFGVNLESTAEMEFGIYQATYIPCWMHLNINAVKVPESEWKPAEKAV